MRLKELKKKLSKPEDEFEERLESPEPFRLEKKRKKVLLEDWPAIEKKEKQLLSADSKKFFKKFSLVALAIFLIVVGFLFWRGLNSFDKDRVKLEIKGPERIVSGDEIRYVVKYQNKTKLDLENVELVFNYPENSILLEGNGLSQTFNLPNLAPGEENELELSVRVIGFKNEKKKAWAELSYQPKDISSRYVNQAEFFTEIISVPLVLNFDLPPRLVSGQSFDFSIRYLNQAEVSFENLQVRVDYPDGFTLESAEPPPIEEDRVWNIRDLIAKEEGEIFLRGGIKGNEGDIKIFKAQLGVFENNQFSPYTESVESLQISLSPLAVSQTINGSTDYIARAGDILKYQINYANTTDVGIRDVVITSKLEGGALDFGSLEIQNGSFDEISQTITWKASGLADLEYLAPHQKGQVNFSVKVKNPLPIRSFTDKNFTISNLVKINSLKIPLSLKEIEIAGQNHLSTKIASRLTLQSQGYYNDDLIPNSGPIPPRVGKTTTYTIKWRLINTSNDLDNVEVRAFLPPHVQWKNKISPANADLSYNSQTGQLVWQIGNLPAATGVLLPVKQVAFQVAVTPSLSQVGSLIELIGQAAAIGRDNFVDLELNAKDDAIDTNLPDDPAIGYRDGVVVE
jgi:hypothetical protein